MKILALILLILLVLVQSALWFGHQGVSDLMRLNRDTDELQTEVEKLENRNRSLAAEVLDLRTGTTALEERARSDLGMIRPNETFFQVIEQEIAHSPMRGVSLDKELDENPAPGDSGQARDDR